MAGSRSARTRAAVGLAGCRARLVLFEPDDRRVLLGELLLEAVGTERSGRKDEGRENRNG